MAYTMIDDEPQQQCPFCFQIWGECSHYELMTELEAESEDYDLTGVEENRPTDL